MAKKSSECSAASVENFTSKVFMQTKVRLHGSLARDLGRENWTFYVDRPYEILQALEANTNKLVTHLYENLETQYCFMLDGAQITDFSQLLLGDIKEIDIVPVLQGEGGSGGTALLIIGLIVLAVVAWWAAPVWGGAIGASFGVAGATLTTAQGLLLTVGLALTLGGIAQMLAPTPDKQDNDRPENKASYIYNGPVNTLRQGNPVPFGAGGPLIIGSQIISAGIRSVDILEHAT
jgi:predicted phage tail protein